ncbi:MAG: hypothetical protein HY323_17570 [Betaproteobacteria bacterium]|nr:hypothetical protein [Betaproteobacteria bacterium]
MLPPLDENGDLPLGIHSATWAEVAERFGIGSEVRVHALARLRHLHELAARTGKLKRFCVFGSFVSSTTDPHDVDVALVMAADFRLEESPRECRTIFSHADAQARYGASVFWLREGMVSDRLVREFLETWQIKRDGAKRGIVDIQT